MKLLIIGGTYFLGKAFLELCDDGKNEITVLNRGTKKILNNEDGHLREIHADRHKEEELEAVLDQFDPDGYDCVVDFCAYEAGDIRKMLDAISGASGARQSDLGQGVTGVKQYVFVSTCDVYRRGTGKTLTETSEFEERDFGGAEGAYICGKVALEKELASLARERNELHFTSIRPTFIYGPENYAPREDMFFQWITKAGQVLFPEDADGSFQMVYVKDLAKCIYACLLKEEAYDRAFNVCGEPVTYQSFVDALENAVGKKIGRVNLAVSDVLERGIPLPFPLTKEESESYDGTSGEGLGVSFTPLAEGLRETYAWYVRTR